MSCWGEGYKGVCLFCLLFVTFSDLLNLFTDILRKVFYGFLFGVDMSRDTYQIEFIDRRIRVDQILVALNEMAREMDLDHKKLLSELSWVSKNAINPPNFEEGAIIFEAKIPDELTRDLGVSNEVIRVHPVSDGVVQVVITDASLPPGRCEEIAVRFAQQLYGRITGRQVGREGILLKKIASLEVNVCEYCLKPIEGLPYRCRNCGRTFCYDHRRPETHGCPLNEKLRLPEGSPSRHGKPEKFEGRVQPEIIVRKIPCG